MFGNVSRAIGDDEADAVVKAYEGGETRLLSAYSLVILCACVLMRDY